jgi:hypothetical protein
MADMHSIAMVMDTTILYSEPTDDSVELVDAKFVSSLLSQLQLVVATRRAVLLMYDNDIKYS